MVRFRGIDISIVSQFDIRKLPEFSLSGTADPFKVKRRSSCPNDTSTASCYVPIYPGSQIWFEYSVDGPHPPNASYFFKMLHRGQVVTSWDCTAKHGYHGKTNYNLHYIGNDNYTGIPLLKRQAFKFSVSESKVEYIQDDCLVLRVHRIEHRQKISVDGNVARDFIQNMAGENPSGEGFCLTNAGLLDPRYPQTRYRYQLLDPVDEPYATFRFYYRSYEFLEEHSIVSPHGHSRPSSSSSAVYYEEPDLNATNQAKPSPCHSSCSTTSSESSPSGSGPEPTHSVSTWLYHHRLHDYDELLGSLTFGELSALTESDLRSVGVSSRGARRKLLRGMREYQKHTRIHEIENSPPSGVLYEKLGSVSEERTAGIEKKSTTSRPRSSEPSRNMRAIGKIGVENLESPLSSLLSSQKEVDSHPREKCKEEYLESPSKTSKASGSRVKKKRQLIVNFAGTDFDLEKKGRPMSPFTSGGMLRGMRSPTPPSTPATATEFGPMVQDELEVNWGDKRDERQANMKYPITSRDERGGNSLMRFLGRRVGWIE